MNLSPADLHQLADLAISAATGAGRMIERSRPSVLEYKVGGESLASQVVTEVDRQSEDIILDVLFPTVEAYKLGLLTEERDDDNSRLTADYFWCIDPLDGTLPFIESSPGYAVSIALVDRNGIPQLGVVYDPVEATVLHAIAGFGAFHNGDRWLVEPQPQGQLLSVFADRSFLHRKDHDALVDELDQIAQDMGLAGVHLDATAGAVINACRVLTNPPACYFKLPKPTGGGSLWDFAATACLFDEVGAVATSIDGRRLDLNRGDSTSMNHQGVLFATDEALAERIRALRTNASAMPGA